MRALSSRFLPARLQLCAASARWGLPSGPSMRAGGHSLSPSLSTFVISRASCLSSKTSVPGLPRTLRLAGSITLWWRGREEERRAQLRRNWYPHAGPQRQKGHPSAEWGKRYEEAARRLLLCDAAL